MEQESFKVLEYKRILSKLREKAGTTLGKELAGGLLPSGDREEVRERLQQTAEAVYVSSMAQPPLGGIKDIRESIKKVGLGAVLAPDELLDILTTMYAMREMKRFFKELEAEAPILKNWARSLEILGQLEKDLEHIVDEHGNLRDDASVELKRIRREIRSSQAKIKDHLAGLLHNNEYQKYFQEAIVTMRGDRYVLPVKQEYRQHFPGRHELCHPCLVQHRLRGLHLIGEICLGKGKIHLRHDFAVVHQLAVVLPYLLFLHKFRF